MRANPMHHMAAVLDEDPGRRLGADQALTATVHQPLPDPRPNPYPAPSPPPSTGAISARTQPGDAGTSGPKAGVAAR
ncbi:hypothetical protein [Microtetraspora fusca]|uniref:hypothetical protein n=1 Tax=Microtetraspora fusca TaxID=1997 RepID=UPI001C3F4AF2|nr:hypothetical protein [Microtetraspora fusca]